MVVASILQNLTVFAFGLVLLGLVELLGIVPLADASNASMVLALVNSLGVHLEGAATATLGASQTRSVGQHHRCDGGPVASGLAQPECRCVAAAATRCSRDTRRSKPGAGRRVRTETSPPRSLAIFGALSGVLGVLTPAEN